MQREPRFGIGSRAKTNRAPQEQWHIAFEQEDEINCSHRPECCRGQLGIYAGWPQVQVSPLEGIATKAAALGMETEYAMGCVIQKGFLKPIEPQFLRRLKEPTKPV